LCNGIKAIIALASATWRGTDVSRLVLDILTITVVGGLITLIYMAILSSLPGRLK